MADEIRVRTPACLPGLRARIDHGLGNPIPTRHQPARVRSNAGFLLDRPRYLNVVVRKAGKVLGGMRYVVRQTP